MNCELTLSEGWPRDPEAVNDTDTERDVCKKQSALQGEARGMAIMSCRSATKLSKASPLGRKV